MTCAVDLRQLLKVPLRSQGYCDVGKGLLGHNWVCWNGRRPHLEWRQEPQVSFPFLTPIAGSLQSWDRRVMPRLEWRNGTLLASRVVHGMTGLLSSCVWNLWLLPNDSRSVSDPSFCAFVRRVAFEEVSGHRVLLKSGPGNRGISACDTTHDAMSRIYS